MPAAGPRCSAIHNPVVLYALVDWGPSVDLGADPASCTRPDQWAEEVCRTKADGDPELCIPSLGRRWAISILDPESARRWASTSHMTPTRPTRNEHLSRQCSPTWSLVATLARGGTAELGSQAQLCSLELASGQVTPSKGVEGGKLLIVCARADLQGPIHSTCRRSTWYCIRLLGTTRALFWLLLLQGLERSRMRLSFIKTRGLTDKGLATWAEGA